MPQRKLTHSLQVNQRLPFYKGVRVTESKGWAEEIKEAFGRLGLKADNDCCLLIGQAVDNKLIRQNGRIDKIEEQVNAARVAMAETDGRIDNVRISMEGEIKLVYEMLSRMGEKIERIETNTSKEHNVRMTWRIALIAAVPAFVSMIITIMQLLAGGV